MQPSFSAISSVVQPSSDIHEGFKRFGLHVLDGWAGYVTQQI
jgi:hypothetical protein